ncbi:MAG: hypothetical protein JO127_09650 [Caulobacteraceae bacterium]|nr:hypothetical protein [Caulobacteraceae bacterium]
MPMIEITEATDARLKGVARPLQDTYDSVIARLLDAYEAHQKDQPRKPGEPVKVEDNTLYFDAKSPPPLAFTTLTRVVLDGEEFTKADTFWNKLMNRMIVEAAKAGHDPAAILKMLSVNAVPGEKTDNGYTFLSDAGLSVQGTESNAAFRQAFQLAAKLGRDLRVFFYWQDNEKAVYPGHRGVVEV